MHLYFVSEANVAYYQSPMFGKIIDYVAANPRDCIIRQNNDKRSIIIANVTSVEHAVGILATITTLP